MNIVQHPQPISVQDYLSGEQNARHRHEYVAGEVYAMVGASNTHNRIATNATVSLGTQLRGKNCQVFNSDTKIRVRMPSGTRFYYPDASVVCQTNSPHESFQDSPVVVIEVISESTRRTDELEKREAYLSVNSLFVYILVEQSSAAVAVYRRNDEGFTKEHYLKMEDVIPLPEIGCEVPLADLYENVEFTPEIDPDEEFA